MAVGGQGLPLVLASGLLLTDRLYVQTLSRLAATGFRVVAVDVAGSGISDDGKGLDEYGRLLGRVLDELGVERAVLAGHSLGGRLVTELAARSPERVVGLLLVDASVGAPWDSLVRLVGWAPPSVGVLGAMLLADTLGTVPLARDLGQAAKLSRLAVPVVVGHLSAPWRLFGPGLSALYAAASAPLLDRVGRTADAGGGGARRLRPGGAAGRRPRRRPPDRRGAGRGPRGDPLLAAPGPRDPPRGRPGAAGRRPGRGLRPGGRWRPGWTPAPPWRRSTPPSPPPGPCCACSAPRTRAPGPAPAPRQPHYTWTRTRFPVPGGTPA